MTPSAPSSSSDLAQDEIQFVNSTILIVDDNDQNVELVQAYLEPLGCKVLTASDGRQAIDMVESDEGQAIDLILLDVMMPRMSGFEVCRKLKDDPATRHILILMVTALNELGDIERGVESGTDDFISKPVNKLELLTRVKSLLRVRHLKQQMEQVRLKLRNQENGV